MIGFQCIQLFIYEMKKQNSSSVISSVKDLRASFSSFPLHISSPCQADVQRDGHSGGCRCGCVCYGVLHAGISCLLLVNVVLEIIFWVYL